MYYKNGRITASLPNKLELNEKVIFNPKWHHYEDDGWKLLPDDLKSIERRFIKWVNGYPVEMTESEKAIVVANSEPTSDQRISELWNHIDSFIRSQMDENARHSINLMLVNPATTEDQMQRLFDYGDWWTEMWTVHYAGARQIIMDGGTIDLTTLELPECPYTIWEILG